MRVYFEVSIESESPAEKVSKLKEIKKNLVLNPIFIKNYPNVKLDIKNCEDDEYVVIGMEILIDFCEPENSKMINIVQ
jgi:hypothetical protein